MIRLKLQMMTPLHHIAEIPSVANPSSLNNHLAPTLSRKGRHELHKNRTGQLAEKHSLILGSQLKLLCRLGPFVLEHGGYQKELTGLGSTLSGNCQDLQEDLGFPHKPPPTRNPCPRN